MRTLSTYSSLIVILSLSLLLGCTESPVAPASSPNDQTVFQREQNESGTLDEEFGPLPSFPTSFITLLDDHFDVFVIRLVWGSGDANTAVSASVDWSGKLWMNAVGALWTRRTIDFEEGQDELFRTNAFHTVAWRSITENDRDGILVEAYLRNDVVYIMEPRLWFDTRPLNVSFSFEQLRMLDTVIYVDGIGALSVKAREFERVPCPRGPLGGHWRFTHNDAGMFEGTIRLREDIVVGKLAGRFWTTDDGKRVFEGRWQTLAGIFHGPLRGHWKFDSDDPNCLNCDRHMGRFRGAFFTDDGRKIGNLYGRFGPGPDIDVSAFHDPKTGIFKGFWGVDCDRDGTL